MSALTDWIGHRMEALGITSQDELADIYGVGRRSTELLFLYGTLGQMNASSRRFLARAMRVTIEEIAQLDDGRLVWISDDRRVHYDRPKQARDDDVPVATLDELDALPLIGAINVAGVAQFEEFWEPEFGRRFPMRFKRNGWRYAMDVPGGTAVFELARPWDLRGADRVIVQISGDYDCKGVFGTWLPPDLVRPDAKPAIRLPDGDRREFEPREIARVSRRLREYADEEVTRMKETMQQRPEIVGHTICDE